MPIGVLSSYVDSKSLKNELPPQFVHFLRNCLFTYGEKMAILPKNLCKSVVFKGKIVSLQRKSGNIAKKSS